MPQQRRAADFHQLIAHTLMTAVSARVQRRTLRLGTGTMIVS